MIPGAADHKTVPAGTIAGKMSVKRACGTLFVYWRGQRVPQRVEDVEFFEPPRIPAQPNHRNGPVSASTRDSPSPAIKRPADSETDLFRPAPDLRGLGASTKVPAYCPSQSPNLPAWAIVVGFGCSASSSPHPKNTLPVRHAVMILAHCVPRSNHVP